MRRSARLLIGLGVIAVALAFILWNTSAQTAPAALGVSEAKQRAHEAPASAASVRGSVVEGSILYEEGRVVEFVMMDSSDQLRVHYNRTPPDNFGAKEVVVTGLLHLEADVPWLQAESIQVGCASKY